MGINYRIPDLEGFNAVNAFIGEGTINVTCLDPTAEIHYTTDGSTPTLQSPVYEGPIKVTETTDFTFCTFRPNGKKGDIAKTRFIKVNIPLCNCRSFQSGFESYMARI